MSTTFNGDLNALNSSETAPRDEVILGQFNVHERMVLTIWDHYKATWIVPRLCEVHNFGYDEVERSFQTVCHGEEALTGWLPVSTVDLLETEA